MTPQPRLFTLRRPKAAPPRRPKAPPSWEPGSPCLTCGNARRNHTCIKGGC